MNKVQMMTIRAMFLVSTGIVILLDVLGVVREGVSVFLAFLAIFVILYGLSLLGFWGLVYRLFSRVRGFFSGATTYLRKKTTKTVVKKKSNRSKTGSVKAVVSSSKRSKARGSRSAISVASENNAKKRSARVKSTAKKIKTSSVPVARKTRKASK